MQQSDVREAMIMRLHNTLQWQMREFGNHQVADGELPIDTLAIDEQLLVTVRNGEVSVAVYVPPAPVIEYIEVPVAAPEVVSDVTSEPAPEVVSDVTSEPAPEEWPEEPSEEADASVFAVPDNVTPVSRSRRSKG